MQEVKGFKPQISPGLKTRRGVLKLLAAIAALIILIFPIETMHSAVPGRDIVSTNHAFLQSARNAAIKDMLLLAEADAVVSVVDTATIGVSVGVSADVKIGNALSSLSDLLQQGVQASLIGAGFYEVSMIVSAFASAAEPYVLKLLALIILVHLGLAAIIKTGPLPRNSRILLELIFLVFIALRLAVPYGISGAAFASDLISTEILGSSQQQVKDFHEDVTHGVNSAMEFSHWTSKSTVESGFQNIAADFPHNLEVVGAYGIRRLVVSLFEGILLPFGIMVFLMLLFRHFTRQYFTASDPN